MSEADTMGEALDDAAERLVRMAQRPEPVPDAGADDEGVGRE